MREIWIPKRRELRLKICFDLYVSKFLFLRSKMVRKDESLLIVFDPLECLNEWFFDSLSWFMITFLKWSKINPVIWKMYFYKWIKNTRQQMKWIRNTSPKKRWTITWFQTQIWPWKNIGNACPPFSDTKNLLISTASLNQVKEKHGHCRWTVLNSTCPRNPGRIQMHEYDDE